MDELQANSTRNKISLLKMIGHLIAANTNIQYAYTTHATAFHPDFSLSLSCSVK